MPICDIRYFQQSRRIADSVEKNDGTILVTEAGDISVIIDSQTQRIIKKEHEEGQEGQDAEGV